MGGFCCGKGQWPQKELPVQKQSRIPRVKCPPNGELSDGRKAFACGVGFASRCCIRKFHNPCRDPFRRAKGNLRCYAARGLAQFCITKEVF